MTKDEKRIYGLIGSPVSHSLSPAMHNAAFRALKINAEYKLFELKVEDLSVFLKSASCENIYGLNVTVPYKEKVLPFLTDLSREAKLIGAVNTLRISKNKLEGFNTDGEGFLRHLTQDLGFNPKGRSIAIIGAGGATKAISVYLSKQEPERITIYDVDKKRCAGLINRLRENFKNINFNLANSIEELKVKSSDLLINATPIGSKSEHSCLVDEKFMHKNLFVYDLIYIPQETKLLKVASELGARTSNGLGMLLYQGMSAFEIWTGRKAPKEVMQEALQKERIC